jgi:hypothetical protein
MSGEGFGNLRVLSLESRRSREMGVLITNHGGLATVIASTREVPAGPNAEESGFARGLVQGQFQVVIFMTGVGTRALAQAIEPSCPPRTFSRSPQESKCCGTGPKPVAVLRELPLTEESELRRNLHPYPPENLQILRKTFAWVTDDYDKIPAERVVMNDRELPGTVLRLPMVYGPGDPLHRFYSVVKRISDKQRHIIFPETLAAWRSPRGYVENVAAAIALAATDERAARRIYNVCEQPSFSELEWARKIASVIFWNGEFVILPVEHTPPHLLRPGNAAQHWTASSARIRRELEYQEPVAIEDAIQRTISWEKENPPTDAPLAQFDYPAEDAAVAAHKRVPNIVR